MTAPDDPSGITDPDHKPPTEPSAVMRAYAKAAFSLYTALIAEGFTTEQAIRLTSEMLITTIRSNS